jgi:hypothetical protein
MPFMFDRKKKEGMWEIKKLKEKYQTPWNNGGKRGLRCKGGGGEVIILPSFSLRGCSQNGLISTATELTSHFLGALKLLSPSVFAGWDC